MGQGLKSSPLAYPLCVQVVNGNPLLGSQWGAVSMVFTGLIASTLLKTRGHGKGKKGSEQNGKPHSGVMSLNKAEKLDKMA